MSLVLSEQEIIALCEGLTQPAAQLRELHRQGFYRARRGRVTGRIVLERAHYDAVATSRPQPANEPKVHAPRVRRVA